VCFNREALNITIDTSLSAKRITRELDKIIDWRGKPTQISFIERFNRSYRQEILSAFLFDNFSQVRTLTDEWINVYNRQRPHSSLKDLTPDEIYYEPEKSPKSLLETVAEIWE